MFSNFQEYEALIPVDPPAALLDLDPRLQIYVDDSVEIWYAPMGKPISKPKLWILGITPGWNQMRIAYEGAAKALAQGRSPAEAALVRKPQVAFAGSMRKNLISMMDEIGINEVFQVETSARLFGTELIRTGSILKYPVFKKGRNYTGHSPSPTKHEALLRMLDIVLAEELISVGRCLILPLGKAVETALEYSASKGRLELSQVLLGFPHPSGANGHRKKQFTEKQGELSTLVENWYRDAA